jgi:transcriptional regulator with XRE-family HTH domain
VPPKSAEHAALGRAIRSIREDEGIPQEELAYRAGIHRSYMGAIERGEINLSYAKILQLAQAVGLSASELIRRAESNP